MKYLKPCLAFFLALALFANFAEAWRRRRNMRRLCENHINQNNENDDKCIAPCGTSAYCFCKNDASCYCSVEEYTRHNCPNEDYDWNDDAQTKDFAGDNTENIPCDWTWSECSVTCGGGVQNSVVIWKSDDDFSCDPPKERPCNLQPCK